jgi:signal transduction histidine kinase
MSKGGNPRFGSGEPDPPRLWLFGIRTRLFLSLALLAAMLLIAAAILVAGQARRELEDEMALRLQSVGAAAVELIRPEFVPALLGAAGPEDRFDLRRPRRTALLRLGERTGVRRIFLADTTGRSFLDTDGGVSAGTPLSQLRTDRMEMRAVRAGRPTAAPLFRDADRQYRKSAYVPVLLEGRVVGLVGVMADADFLSAVEKLRVRVFAIGAGGILAAFLLAAPLARTLTRPLGRIIPWARGLGAGDLSCPAPAAGRDEIGFLAGTLEQMRLGLDARDREQRAMVAGVAHEIRNPLGGIRLYAEILAADPATGAPARERLGKMLCEMDRLGTIVDEFLLFARPAVPAPELVDLVEVGAEILDAVAPQAERQGVRCALEIAGAANAKAWVDPNHLRQVLRNLVLNAVEVGPADSTVRVGVEPGPAGTFRVSVEDEGPGIAPEASERIFEPFYTTKAAGAGLGLAIVRRLCHLNRATVECGAAAGGGARFTVTLRGPGPMAKEER